MNNCQFILSAHSNPEWVAFFCDKPASIKRDGVWLCTEHYDFVEDNATNIVAQDRVWLPMKIYFED